MIFCGVFALVKNKPHPGVDDPLHADLCPDPDLLAAHLGVVSAPLPVVLQLYLAVPALAGPIVPERVQWVLAGVGAAVTQFGLPPFVLLPALVLKASALHVLVKALARLHRLSLRLCYFPSSLSTSRMSQ